jgi:acetyl-CoA acetyltransferase
MDGNNVTDVVVVGCAETKIEVASGRSAYDLAGEAMAGALADAGIAKDEIDGFVVTNSMSEAGNPFWSNIVADCLGLELDWCQCIDVGGASFVAGVARAALAIRGGACNTVLVLAADAQSTAGHMRFGAYRTEWQDPVGLMGPPGVFGLLTSRYMHQFPLDFEALAKLAVVQRNHALLNELACERLRVPLTREDYLNSRIISDPIRLLDCVMVCDGASAVIVTSEERARSLSLRKRSRIMGYGERVNHQITDPCPDITQSGHSVAGRKALAQAGLRPADIRMFHPYDDFLIAVLIQFEQIGFCEPGEGSRFVLSHDLSHTGELPLNTGGGQISAGQAGLAGGAHNFVEATRQLFGAADKRQVQNAKNAMVTGIGTIPYARNWSTSSVMILEAGD